MHRKWMLFAAVFLLVMFSYTYSTQAFDPIKIRIDGVSRNLQPPAQVVNSRTMVPLRFIIEDPALSGQVYWDASQRKVAIDCRGKYIELFIGKAQASVDGKACYLDSPPYIYQDRTFVPLRFITEVAGAKVNWLNANREVDIRFTDSLSSPRVFAYYYRSPLAEMENNAHLYTDIAFRWFKTDAQGNLSYEYKADYAKILNWARQKEIKTHASVVLMGEDPLNKLLSSPANRNRLINNLFQEVIKNNYDGVNIDFEFIKPADADKFTQFLRELKAVLGSQKELSVAVFARTGKEKWPTPYQYDKIGAIADSVVVMSYDYHYTTSGPGAVAPLWWVKECAQYMVNNMPGHKVLMGMATYGYNWPENSSGTSVTASRLAELKTKYKVREYFDEATQSPYYTYWDEWGQYHQIWMENQTSLSKKYQLVEDYSLAGIAFWRIGTGFDDLYRVLQQKL